MKSRAIRLVHVVPTFYPALYWGGPIVSVYELCNHLARIPGIELRVVTTDAAGPRLADRLHAEDRPPSNYPGYDVTFCRRVMGVSIAPAAWAKIWGLSEWADVIHLTAVYSSTTLPTLFSAGKAGVPVVWSPRGALQRWMGTRRQITKGIWDSACRTLISPSRTVLHVTSEAEGMESLRRFPDLRCEVIPNGVEIPQRRSGRSWTPGGRLRLGFLGRLDPKKGLENLLQAVAALPLDGYSLDIYGTGDASYLKALQEYSIQLGTGQRVKFRGQVDGEAKSAALEGMDVLVVPSHTENFALVVAEALAHCTPVIASTGTPWKELDARGAGRCVANDPESLAKAIAELRHSDLVAIGLRGREWMSADYRWPHVAGRMAELYRRMLPEARIAA